jgi:hypothetical protein
MQWLNSSLLVEYHLMAHHIDKTGVCETFSFELFYFFLDYKIGPTFYFAQLEVGNFINLLVSGR